VGDICLLYLFSVGIALVSDSDIACSIEREYTLRRQRASRLRQTAVSRVFDPLELSFLRVLHVHVNSVSCYSARAMKFEVMLVWSFQ